MRRAALKHGIWNTDVENEDKNNSLQQCPIDWSEIHKKINRRAALKHGIWNTDVENEDKNNSLQQCPIKISELKNR